MSDHTAGAFDRELDGVGARIAEMGGVASRMVSDAVLALSNADSGLAQAVVERDPCLDALQHEVDEQAVLTIARRQPVAQDLREIIGAMRVAGALERVGDLAKSIALRAMMVDPDRRPAHTTAQIRQMSEVAVALVGEGRGHRPGRAELTRRVIRRAEVTGNLRKPIRRTPKEIRERLTTFVLTGVAVALSAVVAAMVVARYF